MTKITKPNMESRFGEAIKAIPNWGDTEDELWIKRRKVVLAFIRKELRVQAKNSWNEGFKHGKLETINMGKRELKANDKKWRARIEGMRKPVSKHDKSMAESFENGGIRDVLVNKALDNLLQEKV